MPEARGVRGAARAVRGDRAALGMIPVAGPAGDVRSCLPLELVLEKVPLPEPLLLILRPGMRGRGSRAGGRKMMVMPSR